VIPKLEAIVFHSYAFIIRMSVFTASSFTAVENQAIRVSRFKKQGFSDHLRQWQNRLLCPEMKGESNRFHLAQNSSSTNFRK